MSDGVLHHRSLTGVGSRQQLAEAGLQPALGTAVPVPLDLFRFALVNIGLDKRLVFQARQAQIGVEGFLELALRLPTAGQQPQQADVLAGMLDQALDLVHRVQLALEVVLQRGQQCVGQQTARGLVVRTLPTHQAKRFDRFVPLALRQQQFPVASQRIQIVRSLRQRFLDPLPQRFALIKDRQPVRAVRQDLVAVAHQIAQDDRGRRSHRDLSRIQVDLQQFRPGRGQIVVAVAIEAAPAGRVCQRDGSGPSRLAIRQPDRRYLLGADEDDFPLMHARDVQTLAARLRFPCRLAGQQVQAVQVVRFGRSDQHAAVGDRHGRIDPPRTKRLRGATGQLDDPEPCVLRLLRSLQVLVAPQQRPGRHVHRDHGAGRRRADQHPALV